MSKLLAEFIIPEYLREIQVSEKQRPKYYTWDFNTIKSNNKKLLQKYINPEFKKEIILNEGNVTPKMLKYPYFIVAVTAKSNKVVGIYGTKQSSSNNKFEHINKIIWLSTNLTDKQKKEAIDYTLIDIETKTRVIANSTQSGKPKKVIIKGQDIYSGNLNEFTRAKIVNELKADYKSKLEFDSEGNANLDLLFAVSDYPVVIEMELIDTVKDYYDNTKEGEGRGWDVDNRALLYRKTFIDFLVENNVLVDDDRLHVRGGGSIFTPCERFEDRKLIFRIYG